MSILTTLKEKGITNRARQRTEAFNYLFDEAVDSVSPAEFYLFEYKPKFRKRLDHWDRYPMVIVGDSTPDGFYGANLHYMEAKNRVNLAEKIINKNSPNIPKSIWHRYIIDKADNLFFKIPESDVLEMAVLPLEQFYDCLLYTSPSPRDS